MRFWTAAVLAVAAGLFLGLILGNAAAADTETPREAVAYTDDDRYAGNVRRVIWPERRPARVRELRADGVRTASLAYPGWGLTGRSVPGTVVLDEFLAGQNPGLEPAARQKLAAAVLREAGRQGLDPWLVLAVIRVESNFDPDVKGAAGEIGLMQILPGTARLVARWSLGIENLDLGRLYDPAFNVHLGTAHLAYLLRERKGDLVASLASYNGGDRPGRFSFQYAARVLGHYRTFRAAAGHPQGDF